MIIMVVSSFLQVETHLPTPTGLHHSLLLADIDDSDEDNVESPDAPQYSPISVIDENLPSYETPLQDGSDEEDQQPHLEANEAEIEPNVSHFLLHVYGLLYSHRNVLVLFYCFYRAYRLVNLHHRRMQACGLGTSLWETILTRMSNHLASAMS